MLISGPLQVRILPYGPAQLSPFSFPKVVVNQASEFGISVSFDDTDSNYSNQESMTRVFLPGAPSSPAISD
jgi:hypothetical protein